MTKVKQIVKQTRRQRLTNGGNLAINKWQRRDLNPRPKAYEAYGAATIT